MRYVPGLERLISVAIYPQLTADGEPVAHKIIGGRKGQNVKQHGGAPPNELLGLCSNGIDQLAEYRGNERVSIFEIFASHVNPPPPLLPHTRALPSAVQNVTVVCRVSLTLANNMRQINDKCIPVSVHNGDML